MKTANPTTAQPGPYWIVVAWVTMEGIEPTGCTVRRDGYDRDEYRSAPLAKACTWLHDKTTQGDVAKANKFAEARGYTVFCYEKSENDPLNRARREALAAHAAGTLAAVE